jgi:hypothetical protein
MAQKRIPVIIVHNIAHARAAAGAALAAGIRVRLRSAPGAARYAGAAWFAALIAIVCEEFPAADIEASLDCATDAGLALAALRSGIPLVRFTGPAAVKRKIAAIARAYGAALDDAPSTMDLLDHTAAESALRTALTRR